MSPLENRSRSITHVSTSDEPIVRAAKLTTVASDRLGKFLERGLIGARVRRRPPSREGAWASTYAPRDRRGRQAPSSHLPVERTRAKRVFTKPGNSNELPGLTSFQGGKPVNTVSTVTVPSDLSWSPESGKAKPARVCNPVQASTQYEPKGEG
jgi:hypothetical protein